MSSERVVTSHLGKVIWLFAACLASVLLGCRTSDRIVARANGVTVTERELNEILWQRYGSITVQELVRQKLIEREAKKQGISVNDEEVLQELKKSNLPDNEENRQKVRADLLIEKLAAKKVEVTDEEARQHYERNAQLYEQPERVHLRDITLESKENAEAIWKALKLRGGENFSDLARHFSINPVTRQRDGDMGLVPVKDLHPKLQAIVRKLKVGEFSKPIEIKGEWVILKLERKVPAKRKSFGEVREQIIAQLKQQKLWQMKFELSEKLLRQAKIQIFDPTLKEKR
ncbi:MAG: peptidyl-prolyl cis-trans isomerase [Armatimonadetes bacterium]|nr:peptidyl-prolyl cis-trans isomerase [Armatimonadota bacterium]